MVKKVAAKKPQTTNNRVQKPRKAGKVVKASTVEDVDVTQITSDEQKAPEVSRLVATSKIKKALCELKKFITKKQEEQDASDQLFEDTLIDSIQISFTKKDLFTSKKSFKPKAIKIENKPQSEDKPTVALLVRDDLIDKEMLDKIEESDLNELLGEIIPASELKTTYKQYEKRRQLFSKYDIFLADDHLVTSLPKLLGKIFYESNKVPVGIRVGEKFSIASVTNQVKKTLDSVIYQLPRSNNLVINLGSIEALNESVIEQVIKHFEKEDLKAVFLKSNGSPALPLFEKENAYIEADVAPKEKKTVAANATDAVAIEGLPENVKLSQFERGLLELAKEEQIPQLLASKIKKSQLKAKIAAKKEKRDTKEKKTVKVDPKNKVTKKVQKSKK